MTIHERVLKNMGIVLTEEKPKVEKSLNEIHTINEFSFKAMMSGIKAGLSSSSNKQNRDSEPTKDEIMIKNLGILVDDIINTYNSADKPLDYLVNQIIKMRTTLANEMKTFHFDNYPELKDNINKVYSIDRDEYESRYNTNLSNNQSDDSTYTPSDEPVNNDEFNDSTIGGTDSSRIENGGGGFLDPKTYVLPDPKKDDESEDKK